jgi:peptide/nickel transport system permease protein
MVYLLITLNFFLPRAMPGNPLIGLLSRAGANFSFGEQTRIALEKHYGLHGSLVSQYWHYLGHLAHGDLGRSVVTNAPVLQTIARTLPWTVLLIFSSILVSVLIGATAGVRSAWRRDRPADRMMTTSLIIVWQVPAFLLASILLFVFAAKLGWFPLFGAQTPFSGSFGFGHHVLDILYHLLLPLVVLASGLTALNYLLMRAGMVSELGADYLLMGRAKGLSDRRLKYRYAARNALLPLTSNTALAIATAVVADVVIERVFSYPGMGRLLVDSIGTRNYPVIQGVFLLTSLGMVTVNALADVLYGRLDPRPLS